MKQEKGKKTPSQSKAEINRFNQRKKKVKQICDLYAQDRHSIKECCKKYKIDFVTFLNWNREHDELKKMYENAKALKDEVYHHTLTERAKTSLEKLIEGRTYEEKKIQFENVYEVDEDGNTTSEIIAVEKKVVTTEKTILPNTTAVIFALKNLDPEKWSDKHKVEHSGS